MREDSIWTWDKNHLTSHERPLIALSIFHTKFWVMLGLINETLKNTVFVLILLMLRRKGSSKQKVTTYMLFYEYKFGKSDILLAHVRWLYQLSAGANLKTSWNQFFLNSFWKCSSLFSACSSSKIFKIQN